MFFLFCSFFSSPRNNFKKNCQLFFFSSPSLTTQEIDSKIFSYIDIFQPPSLAFLVFSEQRKKHSCLTCHCNNHLLIFYLKGFEIDNFCI